MTLGSPERDEGMRRAIHADGRSPPAVTFVADLVCPWCYIAFTRLRQVLAGSGATLVWHPFLLNPHLPAAGVTRAHYLERKFGSVAQAHGVHRRVTQLGSREGIDFAFGAIRAQPNTIPAHALVLAAARLGRDADLAAALFRAFFVEGADLGREDVLISLAMRVGLGAADVRELTSETAMRLVCAAHDEAYAMGISGVPVCRFGDDHVIAGAQPVEVLEALLDLELYRAAHGTDDGLIRGATPRSRP